MENAFLIGETIYLRGIEKKDMIEDYIRWANDPEVTYYMVLGLRPANREKLEADYLKMIDDETQINFAIIDKENEKHIGNAGLYLINWIGRTAEFRIIIGEKDYWGKGVAQEAIKLVLVYAFEKLNLEKVWLGVHDKNERARKAYLKAGFIEEGVLRRTWFRNNEYYNDIRMGMLKEEYLKLKSEGKI